MPEVLVVSDSPTVREEVIASLPDPDITVRELNHGADVRPAVKEATPDLVVLDQQIGNMGAMAACLDLHLEQGAGRLPHVPVLMLLDRRADVFLARRSEAEGWVVKPLDPMRLGRAIKTLLAGGTYEDNAYLPVTVPLH
jgi:DNA-binding response OmpR family regulator